MTRFDLGALFAAICAHRERQGMSWAALSREVSVAASTIRRFETATDAEADGVLALIRWLGVAPEEFVIEDGVRHGPLLPKCEANVRVDMTKVAEALGQGGAAGRTRTTIQRLADAAHRSGHPIASFTRQSEL